MTPVKYCMGTLSSYASHSVFTAESNRRTSHPRCRARHRKRQFVGVPLGLVVVFFQTDDGFVLLDVSGTSHADAADRMDADTIRHEFAHPPRVFG